MDNTSVTVIIVTQIIAALLPTLAAIAAWIQAKSTHVSVNSNMDKWMNVERQQGLRDGRDEGRHEERSSAEARRGKPLSSEEEKGLVGELMELLRKYEQKK